jgi:predicted ABC-type transport system involved in lysophospholipase L1 biosynthesis ATPase subunit
VALPLQLNGASRAEERERVRHALTLVGLAERMDHKPHQLSGGEAQRVATARALVFSPRVVFADEPTGSLDSVAGRQIMTLLRDINAETGVTMVIVTHDPVWASLCHRVVRMVDGLITEDLALPDDTDTGSRTDTMDPPS